MTYIGGCRDCGEWHYEGTKEEARIAAERCCSEYEEVRLRRL